MKYFYMKEDKEYVNRPHIINWTSKVSLEEIYRGDYNKVPYRMILEIEPNRQLEFTDVITVPFLLVSRTIKKVIELYEPDTFFKEIILLDKKFGQAEEYFLPLLKRKNVLREKSVFTHTQKIVLETRKIGNTAVFYVEGIQKEAGIWRMDIIESILHRSTYGFKIEEVEVV